MFVVKLHSPGKEVTRWDPRMQYYRFDRLPGNDKEIYVTLLEASLGEFCSPERGMNTVGEQKKWGWRWRNIFISYSTYMILSERWYTKEGEVLNEGPDSIANKIFLANTKKKTTFNPSAITLSENGYYEGPVGRVQRREIHVVPSLVPMVPDVLRFADYVMPVDTDDVCLVVQKAKRVPFTLVLVKPYQPSTWLLLLITLLLAVFTWPVIAPVASAPNPVPCRRPRAERVNRALTDVIGTFITGATYRQVNTQSEKILISSLLIMSVVMINAYTGQIMSFLTTPKYYADLNTVMDAVKNVKFIHAPESVLESLGDNDLQDDWKLLHKKSKIMKVYDENRNIIQFKEYSRLAQAISRYGKDAMTVERKSFRLFTSSLNTSDTGQISLHLVREPVITSIYSAAIVMKGDPIYDAVNAFFMHLFEGGFYVHWRRIMFHRMVANGVLAPPDGTEEDEEPQPLALHQLVAPFALLGMGLTLAAGLLLAQLVPQWRRKRLQPTAGAAWTEGVGARADGAEGRMRARLARLRWRRQRGTAVDYQ